MRVQEIHISLIHLRFILPIAPGKVLHFVLELVGTHWLVNILLVQLPHFLLEGLLIADQLLRVGHVPQRSGEFAIAFRLKFLLFLLELFVGVVLDIGVVDLGLFRDVGVHWTHIVAVFVHFCREELEEGRFLAALGGEIDAFEGEGVVVGVWVVGGWVGGRGSGGNVLIHPNTRSPAPWRQLLV